MSRALLKSLVLGLGLAPGMALAQTANAGGAERTVDRLDGDRACSPSSSR